MCDYGLKQWSLPLTILFSRNTLTSESVSLSVISDSLRPYWLQPTKLFCPWNSRGKNIGVGCHSILRGIFPIQGSNLGLLHCRRVLYYLCHQGSPTLVGYKTSLVAQMVKNPPAVQETQVQSLGWEIPRERNGYPLQYSCLGNPMDRGACQATVHRVGQSWTQLKWLSVHASKHWARVRIIVALFYLTVLFLEEVRNLIFQSGGPVVRTRHLHCHGLRFNPCLEKWDPASCTVTRWTWVWVNSRSWW